VINKIYAVENINAGAIMMNPKGNSLCKNSHMMYRSVHQTFCTANPFTQLANFYHLQCFSFHQTSFGHSWNMSFYRSDAIPVTQPTGHRAGSGAVSK